MVGKVLAPIIRVALVDDPFARLDLRNSVWARATAASFSVVRSNVSDIGRVFRQNRREREQQRHLAVSLVVEGEADAVVADLFHVSTTSSACMLNGNAALVAQELEGEDDIVQALPAGRPPIWPSGLRLNWMKVRSSSHSTVSASRP